MPAEDNTTNHDKGSNKPIKNTSRRSTQSNATDAAENQERGNHRTTTHGKKNENTTVEIVSIPKIDETEVVEANRIGREANEISWWSVRVNGGMFIVTFILAFVAFVSYISSK